MQGDVIDSWEERLRLTLDHFRNENMADFRKNSEAYRRLVREEEEAYAKLDTLNLTEEQREVIEEAFEAQSAAEAEYATESYFCGIADCIRFLKYIASNVVFGHFIRLLEFKLYLEEDCVYNIFLR